MRCACFWAHPFLFTSRNGHSNNSTIFNVFSFDAVLGRDSNLSPSRLRADALHFMLQPWVKRGDNYPTGIIWVNTNSCFVTLTLEDDNSGQFYWRHSLEKEQILDDFIQSTLLICLKFTLIYSGILKDKTMDEKLLEEKFWHC